MHHALCHVQETSLSSELHLIQGLIAPTAQETRLTQGDPLLPCSAYVHTALSGLPKSNFAGKHYVLILSSDSPSGSSFSVNVSTTQPGLDTRCEGALPTGTYVLTTGTLLGTVVLHSLQHLPCSDTLMFTVLLSVSKC